MALPDFTTQDAATYKANIDFTADDHETRVADVESALGGLKRAVIEIGTWDMDTNASKIVSTGLTGGVIRSVTASIIHDGLIFTSDFSAAQSSSLTGGQSIIWDTGGGVTLERGANGLFDNTSYNDGVINRGWLVIDYV